MNKRGRGARSVVLVCLLASAPGLGAADFSGVWLRNEGQSDDVDEKLGAAARGAIEKAERARRGAPLLDEPEVERQMAQGLASIIQAADRLEIELRGAELHVDDRSGRVSIYYLDGQKHVRQTSAGVSLETVSTRRGNRIEVAQKTDQGSKILETYVLGNEADRLELTVRFEAKRLKEPLIIRSIYERE